MSLGLRRAGAWDTRPGGQALLSLSFCPFRSHLLSFPRGPDPRSQGASQTSGARTLRGAWPGLPGSEDSGVMEEDCTAIPPGRRLGHCNGSLGTHTMAAG